jgi:hypothetical protein
MMNDELFTENEKIRMRVSQYVDWAVKLLIVASFTFIWKMYISQQDFIQKQAVLDVRVTQLEKDLARVEGNMVTIETLKRVELYMELVTNRLGIKERIDLVGPGRK